MTQEGFTKDNEYSRFAQVFWRLELKLTGMSCQYQDLIRRLVLNQQYLIWKLVLRLAGPDMEAGTETSRT
jgi:hypothetical protein